MNCENCGKTLERSIPPSLSEDAIEELKANGSINLTKENVVGSMEKLDPHLRKDLEKYDGFEPIHTDPQCDQCGASEGAVNPGYIDD